MPTITIVPPRELQALRLTAENIVANGGAVAADDWELLGMVARVLRERGQEDLEFDSGGTQTGPAYKAKDIEHCSERRILPAWSGEASRADAITPEPLAWERRTIAGIEHSYAASILGTFHATLVGDRWSWSVAGESFVGPYADDIAGAEALAEAYYVGKIRSAFEAREAVPA